MNAADPLPPEQEAIAQRVAYIISHSASSVTDAILTRPEARAYVKRNSEAAFCDWCRKWSVRPHDRGRYSRLALDNALDRESRAGRRATTKPTAREAVPA